MSTLIPLVFPAAKKSDAGHDAGAFPYASIADAHHHSDQPEANNIHRTQQLEAMLKEVQGRAEIVEKQAYEKAYLAGEKAGMALGKKRAEQILDTLGESLQESGHALAEIHNAFAEAAMDVAGFIAKHIITDAVRTDTTRLWEIARLAAEKLPKTDDLCIAVSQDDYVAFNRLLEKSESLSVLSSDAAIKSGTCRIISSQQDILVDPVAAVDACLDALRPTLLDDSTEQARL